VVRQDAAQEFVKQEAERGLEGGLVRRERRLGQEEEREPAGGAVQRGPVRRGVGREPAGRVVQRELVEREAVRGVAEPADRQGPVGRGAVREVARRADRREQVRRVAEQGLEGPLVLQERLEPAAVREPEERLVQRELVERGTVEKQAKWAVPKIKRVIYSLVRPAVHRRHASAKRTAEHKAREQRFVGWAHCTDEQRGPAEKEAKTWRPTRWYQYRLCATV
jgi:predicted TIM-barrel fold metal-dependent hydrolase